MKCLVATGEPTWDMRPFEFCNAVSRDLEARFDEHVATGAWSSAHEVSLQIGHLPAWLAVWHAASTRGVDEALALAWTQETKKGQAGRVLAMVAWCLVDRDFERAVRCARAAVRRDRRVSSWVADLLDESRNGELFEPMAEPWASLRCGRRDLDTGLVDPCVLPREFASLVRAASQNGEPRRVRALLDQHRFFVRSGGVAGWVWDAVDIRLAVERGDVERVQQSEGVIERILRFGTAGLSLKTLTPAFNDRTCRWCWTTWVRALGRIPRYATNVAAQLNSMPRVPLVVDAYRFDRPIARGGMGTVWKGVHALSGLSVAGKIMNDTGSERRRSWFESEVEALAKLEHPHVVSVIEPILWSRASGQAQWVLVMEFVAGGTLEGKCPAGRRWRRWALELLSALAYCHARDVVHLDMKPANILLSLSDSVRLTDFGLTGLTNGQVAGSPLYMAPEQARGCPEPRSDLYSLGCVLWELLFGEPPTPSGVVAPHAGTLRTRTDLPKGAIAWLKGLLVPRVQHRPSTAGAAMAGLLALGDSGWGTEVTWNEAPTSARVHRTDPTFDWSLDDDSRNASTTGREVWREPDVQTSTELEVPERVWRHERDWGRQVPTLRMRKRGDPALLFQDEAVRTMWVHLKEVARTRRAKCVSLRGTAGQGRSSVLRHVVRRARMAGVAVSRTPIRHRLCVLECEEPPADAFMQPWLLVTTNVQNDDVVLRTLGPAGVWWVLQSRLPLERRLAADLAVESAGNARLGLMLLEDQLAEPGVVARSGGFEAAPGVPRWSSARSYWCERLDDGGEFKGLEWLAVEPSRRSVAWLAKRNIEVPEGFTTVVGGRHVVPRALREELLRRMPTERRMRLHEELVTDEAACEFRSYHRLELGEQEVEVPHVQLLSIADRVETLLDLRLTRAARLRRAIRWTRASSDDVRRAALDSDPAIAVDALVLHRLRFGSWRESLRLHARRLCARYSDPALLEVTARDSLFVGDLERVLALSERGEACEGGREPGTFRMLRLAASPAVDVLARGDALLEAPDLSRRMRDGVLTIQLHHLNQRGLADVALAKVLAQPDMNEEVLLNGVTAAWLVNQLDAVDQWSWEALPFVMNDPRPSTRRLLSLSLLITRIPNASNAVWNALERRCFRPGLPRVEASMRCHLETLAPSHRRDRVLALLSGQS